MYAVETSRKMLAVKRPQMEEGEVTYRNTCYGHRVARGESTLDVKLGIPKKTGISYRMFLHAISAITFEAFCSVL